MKAFQREALGLHYWHDDDLIVFGGMRSGMALYDKNNKGYHRLKYVIYDNRKLSSGVVQQDCEVGFCEMFIDHPSETQAPYVFALINIELKKANRRQGTGKLFVDFIKTLTENNRPLILLDIKNAAIPFWKKQSAVIIDRMKREPITSKTPASNKKDGVIPHSGQDKDHALQYYLDTIKR